MPKHVKTSALDRARADIVAGRPDLALDRVTGFLYTLHRRGEYQEAAYLLLGEIHFAMKDYARAGAAWMLTAKTGPDADQAAAAFHARHGRDPSNVLHALKPRSPSELYPEPVRERLKALGYRYRPYKPRSNPHVLEEFEERPRGVRPVEVGCIFFLIMVVIIGLLFLLRFVPIFK
jgi:hypothetical protein